MHSFHRVFHRTLCKHDYTTLTNMYYILCFTIKKWLIQTILSPCMKSLVENLITNVAEICTYQQNTFEQRFIIVESEFDKAPFAPGHAIVCGKGAFVISHLLDEHFHVLLSQQPFLRLRVKAFKINYSSHSKPAHG